jgi:hypothetical protein
VEGYDWLLVAVLLVVALSILAVLRTLRGAIRLLAAKAHRPADHDGFQTRDLELTK